MAGNIARIPHFVLATSPKGLMTEMLKLNVRDGVEYSYKIVFDGKQWVAWYIKILDLRSRISGTKVGRVDGTTIR